VSKVANRIEEIEEALRELEELTSMDQRSFLKSRTARFSARYSIVQIVEASADLGVLILQIEGESARSYREIFKKLALRGIISVSTFEVMARLASLRNMVVHRYWEVDDLRIYREARSGGLEAIRSFIREVKAYLSEKG